MVVQTWGDVLKASFENLWAQVFGWLPSLVGAIIVFIAGLIVAWFLAYAVEKAIAAIKLDSLLKKFGLEEYTKRADINLDSGKFMGQLVYWFLLVVVLLATSDILGFFALSAFLRDVIMYLPNIITAVLIMVFALIAGNVVGRIVRASVMGAKLHMAKFLGSATRWVIVIFGLLTALSELGIAVAIINTLITGIIAMIAIAGGLAFGLGGKDEAAQMIREVHEELKGNK
ncbi:MAG: hypothetical protein PHP03_01050 [Candidatus Pacebacteria bacterium]|nr:hypothetical protein [Candidatus Paceibacterota bacterium]